MKIKCIVHNVWTSNRKLWLGDTDEVSAKEGKVLIRMGKAVSMEKKKPK